MNPNSAGEAAMPNPSPSVSEQPAATPSTPDSKGAVKRFFTRAGKMLGVEAQTQKPLVYNTEAQVPVQDPNAPKTVEGTAVTPVVSADGTNPGTAVTENPVPPGVQRSMEGTQLDPTQPPVTPPEQPQAAVQQVEVQQPPVAATENSTVGHQAQAEINRITTENVPMANNLSPEVRNEVVETMSTPAPVKTDLSGVPDSQVNSAPANIGPSYAERTYEMVKERYPNLLISNKFIAEKVPMQIGGENGLGAGDKMNVLNYGEKVSEEWVAKTGHEREDRAVAFKLREGNQNNRLAFMMDPNDPDRIISPQDANSVNPEQMSDAQLATALVFHKEGDKLIVTDAQGNDTEVSRQMLETGSYVFTLDPARGIALELVGWGSGSSAEDDIIVLHRTKTAPTVAVPPSSDHLKTIRDIIIGTGALVGGTAAALHGGGDGGVTVTEIPREPGPVIEIQTPVEKTTSMPGPKEYENPLQCKEFKDETVQEGDSLTKLIVDVNGVDRYMAKGPNGQFAMDVDLLYRDLMVMIAQPDNMAQLQKDDPEAASLISSVMEMKKVTGGTLSTQELYDLIKNKLNRGENQLVITHPGSEYKIPVCDPDKSAPTPERGTPENPIPPASGSAGIAAENSGVAPQPFDTTRP